MVACSVFFMAVLALVFIERSSRAMTAREDARTDTYRAAMLTLEHLRRELRGGLVTEVLPLKLSYRVPRLDANGEPEVDLAGEALFDPPAPDSLTLEMDSQGRVVRRSPTEPERVFGVLGPEGKLTFLDVDPSRSDLVEIVVLAKHTDPNRPEKNSEYQARMRVFFGNQP